MDTLRRQRRDYHRLTVIYGVLAATLLFMPDRTLTRRLASKVGGALGFGLAAGVSNLLAKATTPVNHHDEDDEDATLQRLNVGLLGFSSLGLLSVPGEAAFLPTPGWALLLSGFLNAARLFGIRVACRGRTRNQSSTTGVMVGPRKATTEWLHGARVTLQGMRVSQETKKRSLTYRNCCLLVLASMVSCLLEGLFCIRYYGSTLGKSLFDISLQWSGVARLFLVSTMIYSLKQLADREKMTTGTLLFVKLNLMVGTWAALVGISQGITVSGYSKQRIEMIAFSLPFFIKGLKALKLQSDQRHHGPLFRRSPEADEDGPF